jgi:hypothetical protein
MSIQKFFEKNLEDILCETDPRELKDRGLDCFDFDYAYRQVYLGKYGIADIVTIKFYGSVVRITIYELKKELVTSESLLQVLRYKKGIDRFMNQYNLSNHHLLIKCVLIGSEIENDSETHGIIDIINDISFYKYNYEANGINFSKIKSKHSFDPVNYELHKLAKSIAFDYYTQQAPKEENRTDILTEKQLIA